MWMKMLFIPIHCKDRKFKNISSYKFKIKHSFFFLFSYFEN
jgi:hypothetical protein